MISEPIVILHLEGSPTERGRERGRAVKDRIRSRLDREMQGLSPRRRERLLQLWAVIQASMRLELPQVLDELHGIAEGADLPEEELGIAFAGMRGGAFAEECSCFVASRSATDTGSTLLAKQSDIPPTLSANDLIGFMVRPESGFSYLTLGMYPEQPVQPEGMNSAGLTVVGCGQRPADGREAYSSRGFHKASVYDSLARVYSECATVNDALNVLKATPRGFTGRTMIVADANGDWARVEISYEALDVRRAEPDVRYTANFVSAGVTGVFVGGETHALLPPRSADPDAYRRYDRYMELLCSAAGTIDVAFTETLLRDHAGGPPSQGTICRHGDHRQLQTFASMIFEPQARRVRVALGRPCESTYCDVQTFDEVLS